MRLPPAVPVALLATLQRQDGAILSSQARAAGVTETRIRTLVGHGWTRPIRGVLVAPNPSDPFRTSLRGALLACPKAVISGVSAARLHTLGGLARWDSAEEPQLLLPAGQTHDARAGVRLRSGLLPGEQTFRAGFPCTVLGRTVRDMTPQLSLEDLICLVDSALAKGWRPDHGLRQGQRKLRQALALADGRSESTFETLLRLLLVRAGVGPDELQFKVFDEEGRKLARLDLAWPGLRLAVEADGREYHDAPKALYRDRDRANDIELEGWTILRFTWLDLMGNPGKIVARVTRAINRLSGVRGAA